MRDGIQGCIRRRTAGAFLRGLCAMVWLSGAAAALPEGFKAETIAGGLDLVAVKVAPDGRVFVTEKKGVIRVVKGDKLLPASFANISAKTDATREKGLLGLALDPDFTANNFVYAFYVDKNHSCYILRWTADGDVAAAGSEKQIFDLGVSGDGDFHHGGDIAFGGDGKLYITRGNRQDQEKSKEQTSLFGKLLRINKDGSIPEDNPRYAENQGNARAVYAWGLRNPNSIALQAETGRMHFLDIADGTFDDEIDEVKKGAHYGAYSAGTLGPIIKKGAGGSAIMGGVFYNRKKPADRLSFPAQYHGKYFWGQFGGNGIRILDHSSKQVTSFDGATVAPINFDMGADGSIYLVTRATQVFDTKGQILKIRYPAGEVPVRVEAGDTPARAVMKWDIRAGGEIAIELSADGPQTLSLRDLRGKVLAVVTASGPGRARIPAMGANGLHVLGWRSGGRTAFARVAL